MQQMICHRRSVRSYRPDRLTEEVLNDLRSRMENLTPLYPDVPVVGRIIDTSSVTLLQKWKTPHFIAIFSDGSDEALVNVGFMYQQLDLYAQSIGLGTCWVGLGSLNDGEPVPQGMKLAVLMAIGLPDKSSVREGAEGFNRRALADISDRPDDRLEPLRLAPSATNSQPWYITHQDDVLHIWRQELGLIKQRTHGRMNKIDTGIGLAHLYVTNPDAFRFFRAEEAPVLDGYIYMGSVML